MKTFESEMNRARVMRSIEPKKSEYWMGYERGLRRAHHGENFGTSEEHELWLSLAEDLDDSRAQRGLGYRDGLEALSSPAATLGRKGGSVKSQAKSDAAKARNARRKAEGKPEGGRPKTKYRIITVPGSVPLTMNLAELIRWTETAFPDESWPHNRTIVDELIERHPKLNIKTVGETI